MSVWKTIARMDAVRAGAGAAVANYLRLVNATTRFVVDPPGAYDPLEAEMPVICAMWHGQHFMMPFVRRRPTRVKVLISRHNDGDINARAAERLGLETIRGSGDHGRRYDRKGGVSAFKAMLNALADGYNVALTADVPKVSRVAGLGIVRLGRASGRPIYPVAVATSRRIELDNWDRSALNLPFSRGAIVIGDPIRVAGDADEASQEQARQAVETGLNAVTLRAYAIVDRTRGNAVQS